VLLPDGSRKLEFRFSIHTDTPIEDKLAEYLTGWFKEVGIQLTTKRLDSSKFTEETGTTALFDIVISGWSVNPDPEEVLGTHLCSRRPTASGQGGGTESFYCDPTYESLYLQQQKELDRGKRAEIIKKMEERLYSDAPVIALYYPNDLEGYRKDRIASITPIPEDKGLLYGGMNPRASMPMLLSMYRNGNLKLDELITNRYRLDQINDAFTDMREGRNIRGIIEFD